MNPTPLPSPAPYTCRNCGAALEVMTDFCPRCGAALQRRPMSPLRVIGSIFLGLFALVLGAAGGCFALFGVIAVAESNIRESLGIIGIAVFLLLCTVGCIAGIIALNRRR